MNPGYVDPPFMTICCAGVPLFVPSMEILLAAGFDDRFKRGRRSFKLMTLLEPKAKVISYVPGMLLAVFICERRSPAGVYKLFSEYDARFWIAIAYNFCCITYIGN